MDGPPAISAEEIYVCHHECFDEETLAMLKRSDSPLEFPGIQYAKSRDENERNGCTGPNN